MKLALSLTLFCLTSFIIPQTSSAKVPTEKRLIVKHIADLQAQAQSDALYFDQGWLSLLHYRRVFSGYKSEADDDRFFLYKNGVKDPQAELLATIPAFFQEVTEREPPKEGEQDLGDKDHALCKFPARFFWLQQHLAFDEALLPTPDCSFFEKWKKQFNAHSLTLVFPAAFINSPSSMFGHTFIRVDPENLTEKNRLLSVSVNYAANTTGDEGQITMIYKGIVTGFDGRITVLPYHLKVKQYSDLESRDIWEYYLNFSPEETQQFIRHIWEAGFVNFDYYYIDENCSYRILAFLEAVRPMGTLDKFSGQVIPANTIQVLEDAGTIKSHTFRPSISSQLTAYVDSLDDEQSDWVKKIISGEEGVEELSQSPMALGRKSAILETSYEAIRYRKAASRIDSDEASKRSFPLLIARSKIKDKAHLPKPVAPAKHAAEGHGSSRLELGAGQTRYNLDENEYLKIQVRPSYHELTDPLEGFAKGAQIEFLNTEFQVSDNGTSKLEYFNVVKIYSLSPRKIYITPKSWLAAGGLKRLRFAEDDFTVGYVEAGFGRTLQAKNGLLFGLLVAEAQADNDLGKGYALSPGLKTGWLYSSDHGQGLLSLNANQFYSEVDYQTGTLALEHTWNIAKNNALVMNLERNKMDEYYFSDFQLSYRLFY